MAVEPARPAPLDVAVICALRCEARPLIQHLELTSTAGIWRSGGVALKVSGVGQQRAARAVEGLAELADAATSWLNVGCAGGRGTIGELLVAHRVSSDASEERWYPQFPFPVAESTVDVRSVYQPESAYPDGSAVYDMEAAGFYAAALSGASLERVHVLKVRVDGPEQPLEELSAERIEAAIEAQLGQIEWWIEQLAAVARSVRARRPAARFVDAFLERWRFTASQQVQLRRLLGRLHALSLPLPDAGEIAAADSREVLMELRDDLEDASVAVETPGVPGGRRRAGTETAGLRTRDR